MPNNNVKDRFAVAVMKSGTVVGHALEHLSMMVLFKFVPKERMKSFGKSCFYFVFNI